MFTPDITSWIEKHKAISDLINNDKKSIAQIAKLLHVTESKIKHYLIHQDIPEHIVEMAFENRAGFPNIEKIRQLELSLVVENFLYNRAVRKIIDPLRLTTDKLQKVKWAVDLDGFYGLSTTSQLIILEKMLFYKELLLHPLQKEIWKMLNQESPV